jgi:hypothetical protein
MRPIDIAARRERSFCMVAAPIKCSAPASRKLG